MKTKKKTTAKRKVAKKTSKKKVTSKKKAAKRSVRKSAKKTTRRKKKEQYYTYDTPINVIEKAVGFNTGMPPDTKLGDYFRKNGEHALADMLHVKF